MNKLNSINYTIGSSVLGRRIQFKVIITDNLGVQISDSSSLSPVVGANTAPYATGTANISQFPNDLNVGTTLLGDYTYSDDEAISPPDRGVRIIAPTDDECLPAFTPLTFGIFA